MEDTIPGWFSILPPLLAIATALTLRTVIPALFLGIWLGAWGVAGLNFAGLGQGLLDVLSVYVLEALADSGHASVVLFSFMIGGLVGITTQTGGMRGIVNMLVSRARSRRDGQVTTAVMGLLVFIDDYANSLVVGRTMRHVTDRLQISREKLAYIVDSTAAPVAGIALVTTWIGYQVGLIGDAVQGIDGLNEPAYLLFLHSLSYSFYPLLALFLVFWVSFSGRDIGPMRRAEQRAADGDISHGDQLPEEEGPAEAHASNALIPLLILVGGVMLGLLVTGEGENLRDVIGSADAYLALMWASMAAVMAAIALPLVRRQSRLEPLLQAWTEGVQSMLPTMIILVLAWALAGTTEKLGTAEFLISVMGDSLAPQLLPSAVFLIAAITAFATGTSWGTMGILLPLVVPLAYSLAPEVGPILHASTAAVLAGAIWGDHCSPISDTTILSSLATGCDHVSHVRTQLPYAVLAAGASLLFGLLPAGFGLPWWLCLLSGAVAVAVVMQVFGRKPETEANS